MDLNTITVADFKEQFPRNFPYLPTWSNTVTYNAEAEVYYTVTQLFYKGKSNGIPAGTLPTNTSFWELYPDDVFNYVLDSDIERAFGEAKIVFNQSLFGDDDMIRLAYLYLTAHYLALDLQAASAGINATGNYAVEGRKVGNVSENYAVPTSIKDSLTASYFQLTRYGQKFWSMAQTGLTGNVGVVAGWTTP